MYDVVFYRDSKGDSEIVDYLDDLQIRSVTSKDARINFEKILSYMGVLKQSGTRIGLPVVRHIEGDLWELRPLSNRIFFFCWSNNRLVLLHHFRKKSQKTPKYEIEKAKSNMRDFLERQGE